MPGMIRNVAFCIGIIWTVACGQDWIRESIDMTINSRFSEAESLITDRIARGDSSIQTWFYYASILNSKMTHFEKQAEQHLFLETLKKVVNRSTDALETGQPGPFTPAQLHFYRGSAYGYLAYFQGTSGSWYPAFKNGLKARNDLERAVDMDPELYDAYLGIGVFQYWTSTRFKWLPLVSDHREEGIANIRKAIEHSNHSSYMAMHQLIYILLDYGDYDQALSYARSVIAAYPESPFMWWAYAHTLYKMKRNPEAAEAYRRLLGLIENDPESNPMHWVACNVKLAEIHMRMKDTETCRTYCETVLSREFTESQLTEPGRKRLDQTRELYERCLRAGR